LHKVEGITLRKPKTSSSGWRMSSEQMSPRPTPPESSGSLGSQTESTKQNASFGSPSIPTKRITFETSKSHPVPPRASEYRGKGKAVQPETLTQSERDWAYAKRALARGDDPDEIIRFNH
jgi:hypothetical protein